MESIGQGKGDGLESSRGKEKREVAETHPGSRAIQKDSELQSQPVGLRLVEGGVEQKWGASSGLEQRLLQPGMSWLG